MTEPDTAALVETVRTAITLAYYGTASWATAKRKETLAALAALAQRLADLEALATKYAIESNERLARADKAEAALRALKPVIDNDDIVTAWSIIEAALTPTEEPEP